MPLLGVALFAYLLWAITLIRRTLYPETVATAPFAGTQKAALAQAPQAKEPEPFVEFALPGSWAEVGFRNRRLGVDGDHEIAAEEIYLRIRAKRNMQNVRVQIAARHTLPQRLDTLAEISSSDFLGAVTKEREQSFQLMQRTYWNVPARFTNPSTGQEASRSIRVEKELAFFPENPRRFLGEIGHLYYFRVTVHHDDGPDEAEFAIDVKKRREGPQSILRALKNIQAVGN